jgi:hypothetical protein
MNRLLPGLIFFMSALFLVSSFPLASAQTQSVTVTPGYINFGMTTSVAVVAPAQGTYTVVVVNPSGSRTLLNYTFTAAGQTKNATYGLSSSGFKALVNQAGTYNVFVEQGAQVVSSTSFYATNKLVVSMDMVDGGTCGYVSGITRGEKMFPRFYISYASNGGVLTNNTKGIYVTYTLPDGKMTNASWDPYAKLYVGSLQPNWNYTNVGTWSPTATIGDAAGNTATYKYAGSPFTITPSELSTNIQVVDATTGQTVTGIYNGQGIVIKATITYPTNAEPVKGFVGPLSSTRGGSVAAQIGWGFYNATSGSWGGKTPGALIATVLMTYSGSNGTWTGQFKSSSLPTLPTGANYEVVISSTDTASPPNTGFATSTLPPATLSSTSTVTTTQSIVQTVQSIPTVVYAALAILLILGVLIGYIVRVPR